ncbi:MAG: hypothetical protein ACXVY5_03840 [Gaiellales bacterium]
MVLAVVAAACSGGSPGVGGSNGSGSSGPPATPRERFLAARPVAVSYVKDLAMHEPAQAAALAAPSGPAAARSLARLRTWLGGIPIGRVQTGPEWVTLPPTYPPDAVGVRVRMRVRIARGALTGWFPLGERVLEMRPKDGGWKVAAEVSTEALVGRAVYGLSLFRHPHFLAGDRATVVYGLESSRPLAGEILRAADAAVPGLVARYPGGPAAARPMIFLVSDRSQGEELSGSNLAGQATPLGTVSGSFTYVYLTRYRQVDAIGRASSIVYLMTLLASRTEFAHAPTSLWSGTAAYEEDAYLGARGYILPLDGIAAAYPGYPSLTRWRSTQPGWGVSGRQLQLASQDALAMVHVIVASHGGAPALRRLGRAFARLRPGTGGYTAAQVGAAFSRGLGTSYGSVAGEARAYVAGGGWKFH